MYAAHPLVDLRRRARRVTRLLAGLALVSALVLVAPAPADAAIVCAGQTATIVGTGSDETIVGTGGNDVIHGRGGADTIDGRGGNDVICGGGGWDIIRGGAGNDVLLGQGGRDTIDGGSGTDDINGGYGVDTIRGGSDDDVVTGGEGHDIIRGGGGDDSLRGGSGKDTISGDAGSDTIEGASDADKLYGNAGDDTISGGGGDDKMWGGPGEDTLHGGFGTNRATGGDDWDVCTRSIRRDPCEGPVFLETFDGDPAQPEPYGNNETVSVSVNSRDGSTRDQLSTMQGQHGAACDAPPATHTVRDYEDAVYNCRNHVMTAISSGPQSLGNYAVAVLSPNAVLDFTGGEATIRFDVSTSRASARDWFEVWITPYEDLLRIPVQTDRPSMQGTPKDGVLVALKAFTRTGAPDVKIIDDFGVTDIDGPAEWVGYEDFLTPSSTTRSTFEIRISKNHITVGMPEENFYWVSDSIPGGLDFTKGIVQFGHNSYDVFNCDECSSGPNTWHWDNLELQPAEAITALAANRRGINQSTPSFVTFGAAAPKNAHLQFTGIGFDLEVSFDNGVTWKPVVTQHNRDVFHWRYKNYWMAVPPGTNRVDFRGADPYDGHWQIQDISILSPDAPAGLYGAAPATAGVFASGPQDLAASGANGGGNATGAGLTPMVAATGLAREPDRDINDIFCTVPF